MNSKSAIEIIIVLGIVLFVTWCYLPTSRDRALTDWQRLYGEATALLQAKDFSKGVFVAEKALKVAQKNFGKVAQENVGPEYWMLAKSFVTLGDFYVEMGDYLKAESLYASSLAIREKVEGPNHLRVAADLNSLGVAISRQRNYEGAEPLFKRSLAIRERALGSNHPDVGASLSNLAALYQDQGEYAKAIPLYERSLAITERAFGPYHPKLGGIIFNLMLVYDKQDNYTKAELLYNRWRIIEVVNPSGIEVILPQ